MAVTKFGSIITDARGSIGGNTIKWSQYGHVIGVKGQSAKQQTPKQTVVRATFTLLSKWWWDQLDATQRTDWRALAAANPFPNRWGDTYPLTGQAFFIRVNQRLLQVGNTILQDAPADQTVTVLTSATLTVAAPSTASLAYAPTTVPTDHALVTRATRQLSPGRTNVDGSYLFLQAAGAGSTSPLNVGSSLGSLAGTFAAGRAAWLQAAFLKLTTGALSPWVTTQAIIT